MATENEGRPVRVRTSSVAENTTSAFDALQHCYALPSRKKKKLNSGIQGMLPSICQKVLKQVVIIYGSLLQCRVAGACLRDADVNFHFRCSSSTAAVSMTLCAAF